MGYGYEIVRSISNGLQGTHVQIFECLYNQSLPLPLIKSPSRTGRRHCISHSVTLELVILGHKKKSSYDKPSPSRLNKIKIYTSVHFSVQANFISVYIWIKIVQSNGHDVPMQPNEIKWIFHIATFSFKIPSLLILKATISCIYKFS